MAQGEIKYNTEKEYLEIPEYGRNVQNMVFLIKTIEDKVERQAYAEEIINLFAIMYPANRHLADYKEKLWNHLYRIADYDIELDIPEGITIHKQNFTKNMAHLPYPQTHFNNRHYGKYTQEMIKNARALEDEEKKAGYKDVIASYMKLAYRTWNKEHFVSDDIIIQDLREISKGELVFDDDYSIENLVSMKNKLAPVQNDVTAGWKKFGAKKKPTNSNNNNNKKSSNNNNKKFNKFKRK